MRSSNNWFVQVCKVDLELEAFAVEAVELVPDTMELLTDTELTQYYIQAWNLDYNHPGERYITIYIHLRGWWSKKVYKAIMM